MKFALLLLVCTGPSVADELVEQANPGERFRRPIALQLNKDGSTLVVANRDSGSVSLIDTQRMRVRGEFQIGERLSSVEYLQTSDCFVATDFALHKIICFRIGFEGSEPIASLIWEKTTPRYPVSVKANSNETAIVIASLWTRQIGLLKCNDWTTGDSMTLQTIDLGFCPGECSWFENERLLVADAFGDQIAIVETISGNAISVHMPGHRTGGLSLSPDGQWIAFSDQRLNSLAHSTRNDVHWGLMVSNQLRWLPVESLVKVESTEDLSTVIREFSSQSVGGPENAKADLGALAIGSNGVVAVAIGGVDELAIGQLDDDSFAFVPVGRRPIAVAIGVNGERCFVANQLDDSISIVDLDDFDLVETISLGATPELDAFQKGERLFFDARLSHDGWMSCHSCHVNGHTNGMLNDNFSDQSFHTPKQVISLLGHGDTLPLTWLGKNVDFETQVRASIESTMQSDDPATDAQVNAIAEFIRRLPAPVAVDVARQRVTAEHLAVGQRLFAELDCIRCHAPPTYTSPERHEVGVRDENGQTGFNPPSLIGLGQRDRYLHDGRFGKLLDLFLKGEHQLPRKLTEQELSGLIIFLKSL